MGDLYEEPEEGWLHDDKALLVENLFYSFPLTLVGSVELPFSINGKPWRTEVVVELVSRLSDVVAKKKYKKSKTKLTKAATAVVKDNKQFKYTPANIPVKLAIAAKGMTAVIRPRIDTGLPPRTLWFHPMSGISLATRGTGESSQNVCYVAKSKTTSGTIKRAIYVYDAGEMCSEVLGTFAQSFNLAIAQLSKAKASARRPLPRAPASAANYRNIEKMRDEETAKYDVASGDGPGDYDTPFAGNAVGNVIYDMPSAEPAAQDAQYDVATGDAGMSIMYAVVDRGDCGEEDIYATLDMAQLVDRLNGNDKVRRMTAVQQDAEKVDEGAYEIPCKQRRPTWVHMSEFDYSQALEEDDLSTLYESMQGMLTLT